MISEIRWLKALLASKKGQTKRSFARPFFRGKKGELTTTQIVWLVIAAAILIALIVFAVMIKLYGTEHIGFLNAVVRSGT